MFLSRLYNAQALEMFIFQLILSFMMIVAIIARGDPNPDSQFPEEFLEMVELFSLEQAFDRGEQVIHPWKRTTTEEEDEEEIRRFAQRRKRKQADRHRKRKTVIVNGHKKKQANRKRDYEKVEKISEAYLDWLDEGNDISKKPPIRVKPPRIASEECGKKFVHKYCHTGKCKLPKNKTHKKRQTRKGDRAMGQGTTRKNRDNRREPPAWEWRKGRQADHVCAQDRGTPRDDRPIVPWSRNKKEGKIIWIREERPSLAVNQINLHFDLDFEPQQTVDAHPQKKQGGMTRGRKRARKPQNKMAASENRRRNRGGPRTPPRKMYSISPEKRRFRQTPDDEELTTDYQMTFHQRDPWPTRPDHGQPHKDYSRKGWSKFVHDFKKGAKRVRRRFAHESIWVQLLTVGAISTVITMQVYILGKLLSTIKLGYEPIEGDDDDDEDDNPKKKPCNGCSCQGHGRQAMQQAIMMETKQAEMQPEEGQV